MDRICNRYEGTAYLINTCNNELVEVSGTAYECISEFTDQAGKTHYHVHVEVKAKGTGDLGNEYVVSQVISEKFAIEPGETSVMSFEESFMVVSKGSAPNFMAKVVYHITVTPDGETRVSRYYSSDKCVG